MLHLFNNVLLVPLCLFFLAPAHLWAQSNTQAPVVRVGSKTFTESVILGEMAAHFMEQAGAQPEHRRGLGGTRVLWDALLGGAIDLYPEYTGTLIQEILSPAKIDGLESLRRLLAARGVKMTASLGFDNNYAIGMRPETSQNLGIFRISDLRRHPQLMFGFSNEFMDRADGWPGLRRRYGLPQKQVQGLDHDLALRGLAGGALDATDLYTTDADIQYYGFRLLIDDLNYFSRYTAVILYRADLEDRLPHVVTTLNKLAGRISESDMIRLNLLVKKEKVPETVVAANFLADRLALPTRVNPESIFSKVWQRTKEHLFLVLVSLTAAILVAVPLGVLSAKRPGLGQVILSLTGIIQTIPSLALLVFMIPFLGIGGPPVIVALLLYSLLPIVRNTCTGLRSIAPEIMDSAQALGLSPGARLRLIELPLASREILAGIKTSAVINVGTATLGALIGAGGYGQPILTGIRLNDLGLILQGAIPAALLALLVQTLFDLAEKALVPKGLRLKPENT